MAVMEERSVNSRTEKMKSTPFNLRFCGSYWQEANNAFGVLSSAGSWHEELVSKLLKLVKKNQYAKLVKF